MPKRDPSHMNAQRERIIVAAITSIAQKGLEGTSMADIWKEAGLSAGALYVHFKNKEDLVLQCMCFELTPDYGPPKTWDELKARMLDFNPRLGLDAAIITRARIHLRAGCINPGERHDVMRQYLNEQIDTVTAWLEQLADAGLLRLRMDAHQTTAAICAHIDGMLWIALARDQSLDKALAEISASLDHLVSLRVPVASA